MIKHSQPAALLGWMDSLGDPARLRLLRLLEQQELGVAELCDVLQMPQSTVSRHLKMLGDEGWTRSRREGTANLYRMTMDELTPPARRLWQLAREQIAEWPAVEQDRLRLQRVLALRTRDPKAFFAGAAGEWDTLREWLYGRAFHHEGLLALLPSTWVIADLGCGTGATSAELAPHVHRVIGVDQSAAMLKAARKRSAALTNVEFRKGDLEHLPLDDGSCDAALMMLVLTYLPQPAAALREAARILKPGGKLVVVDLLRHDREDFRRHMGQSNLGFEPQELTALLIHAALTPAPPRPLTPEPDAKGPALLMATAVRSASASGPSV